MGSQGREDLKSGSGWRIRAVKHSHEDKQGGTTGEQDRLHNPGFQCREIEPQMLRLKKSLWGLRQQNKLPASQESSLERPTGS